MWGYKNLEKVLLISVKQKLTNRNGSVSDMRIGPALSRRLYKVFMGRNPEAMDV